MIGLIQWEINNSRRRKSKPIIPYAPIVLLPGSHLLFVSSKRSSISRRLGIIGWNILRWGRIHKDRKRLRGYKISSSKVVLIIKAP